MASNDPVMCPLCCGLGRVQREQLRATLSDPNLDQKWAQARIQLTKSRDEELAGVSAGQPSEGQFERDVHSWNPAQPLWRRSPKE
jgi:hypothetical protein